MLAAGLLILKWISIILLVVVGLILTLLLLVLMVPVRYRASGSYYKDLKGTACVSWLLHILSLGLIYDGEIDMVIRIFGIRIKSREKAKRTDFDEELEKQKGQPAEVATKEEPVTELTTEEEPVSESAPISPTQNITPHEQAATHEEKLSRQPKTGRKISFSFRRICDKLKEVKAQKDKIMEFLEKEENKASFRLVWKQFKGLIKHILPTKAKGKVRFGFDDPYTTGQVLMYVSPFYGVYAKSLTVIPVFEDEVIEGELSVRGRIRVGTVLVRIGRLLLDKNIRKIWRQFMNH